MPERSPGSAQLDASARRARAVAGLEGIGVANQAAAEPRTRTRTSVRPVRCASADMRATRARTRVARTAARLSPAQPAPAISTTAVESRSNAPELAS